MFVNVDIIIVHHDKGRPHHLDDLLMKVSRNGLTMNCKNALVVASALVPNGIICWFLTLMSI